MPTRIALARHVADRTVWLRCRDRVEGEVDLSDELHGEVAEPLKDAAYFQQLQLQSQLQVHPEPRAVVWPNVADFAPEFLRTVLRVAA